jgi:decaprenylphospho-beta-D-ribofuranose 2-oxidase
MLEIQRPAMRALNKLYYVANRMFARLGRAHTEELFLRFNFEASYTVPPAYLVCGPYGFTIQITFPRSRARDGLVELLGICRNSPCPPVTTILRAHRADDHWISFSENGYSLNFEFHPKRRHQKAARAMVDRLFDATARLGGKVHLAKDQLLTPEQFRRLFPLHVKLSELKDRVDPDGLFASDLARRIGACRTA